MSKEKINRLIKIYYSNPKIQEAIFNFSKNRETIPKYYEGYGKRPDSLQYSSDVIGLVNKGTTSFHCSEEIWKNPLEISSDLSSEELSEKRKSWDLLIDIDSPYLDYSKIAAQLIIEALEKHEVKNYGIKFSGSKGFHIIVPSEAFPEILEGIETRKMFPEWPRAISEYLMSEIRKKYNKLISSSEIDFKALEQRTNLSKEDVTKNICPNCGSESEKGIITKLKCNRCNTEIERKNHKLIKRQLKCIEETCPGYFGIIEKKSFFYCKNCNTSSLNKEHKSSKKVIYTKAAKLSNLKFAQKFEEETIGETLASLDLVLVASRHLFRAPYSLHEKTALASIVVDKEQIPSFSPKEANPLNIKVKNFYPMVKKEEAKNLLIAALAWKKIQLSKDEQEIKRKYKNYTKIDFKNSKITEDLFPRSIKRLLKGLNDGRKRGLFILLTFLRSLNFSPEYINEKIREWNKKNSTPLKEGYLKSQIDWHLKQKRQILPPNYSNKNFYKDLKLIDPASMPRAKNPISEVFIKLRKND